MRAAALIGLALVLAATAHAASAPPITVSATPTQLTLVDRSSSEITVLNPGNRELTVKVTRGDYSISPAGKAVVDPKLPPARSAKRWLTVSPATVHLAPQGRATVHVTSAPPAHATPGDHHALVLLTAAESGRPQVAVRTRLGVVVLVRVGGPLVRRLAIRGLSVQSQGRSLRRLRVRLTNAGNVNERLLRGRITVTLRRGRTATTVTAPARTLLPGTSGAVVVPYRGRMRGRVTAVVRLRPSPASLAGPGAPELAPVSRTFAIRI